MKNDRGMQQAVEIHARDVDAKLRRHRNVVNLAQQLQAQRNTLHEAEHSLELAECGTWDCAVLPDPDRALSLGRQAAELRGEIAQTEKSLWEEKKLATVRLAGWDVHVASCLAEPLPLPDVDAGDEEADDTKLGTLVIMHQAHADSLVEYHDFLLASIVAAGAGDMAAGKALAAIRTDIDRGTISAEHVENAANLWRAARKTREETGFLGDEFRDACCGPSLFDRRPSAVIDHFMSLGVHTFRDPAAVAVRASHRTPHRARRTSAGHGAASKAGDDGDGGDGEPPRPRSRLSFPFTHHLAYSSSSSSAFSATPILGGRP